MRGNSSDLFFHVQVSRAINKQVNRKQINQIPSTEKLLVAEERIGFGSRWQSGGVLGEVRAPSIGQCEQRHYRLLATLGRRQRGDGAADV